MGAGGIALIIRSKHYWRSPCQIILEFSRNASSLIFGLHLSRPQKIRVTGSGLEVFLRSPVLFLALWLYGHSLAHNTTEGCEGVVDGAFSLILFFPSAFRGSENSCIRWEQKVKSLGA